MLLVSFLSLVSLARDQAIEDWSPLNPNPETRWCRDKSECSKVHDSSGGLWTGYVVLLDPAWPWTRRSFRACVDHEVGHSLGLSHSKRWDSIMREGWQEPYAEKPNYLDIQDAVNTATLKSPPVY